MTRRRMLLVLDLRVEEAAAALIEANERWRAVSPDDEVAFEKALDDRISARDAHTAALKEWRQASRAVLLGDVLGELRLLAPGAT